jgi:archaemetzincin
LVTSTRRAFLALSTGALLSAVVPRRANAETATKVVVQPLGAELPDADLDFVRRSLTAFYAVEIALLERIGLPQMAFYPPRQRYRAEKLLRVLGARRPPGAARIVGVTAVDISTTKGEHRDWGILGLATLDGEACVLSSFRCRRSARSTEHARHRLGKVAVHEVGHTLGLPHCPTRGCIMEDGGGTVKTTDRDYDLCYRCRERLLAKGHGLGEGPIPWPKP